MCSRDLAIHLPVFNDFELHFRATDFPDASSKFKTAAVKQTNFVAALGTHHLSQMMCFGALKARVLAMDRRIDEVAAGTWHSSVSQVLACAVRNDPFRLHKLD